MKTSNIRKVLGANVKYYRHLIGYTQEQLAEKSGLSPRYISDIETSNDRNNISLITLYKISIVLGIRIDKFFEE